MADSLLDNAVRFLKDPSVQASPLSSKITFLERKGLTREQVDEALGRVGLGRQSDGAPVAAAAAAPEPALPAGGPSKALTSLVTENRLSWPRIMLYTAILSSAAAALNVGSVAAWLRSLLRRVRQQLLGLVYGEEQAAHWRSPSISLDRLSELREEISELKSSVQQLDHAVKTELKEEVKEVRNSMRYAYSKLEEEVDGLRSALPPLAS